jgi:hypothetical protein
MPPSSPIFRDGPAQRLQGPSIASDVGAGALALVSALAVSRQPQLAAHVGCLNLEAAQIERTCDLVIPAQPSAGQAPLRQIVPFSFYLVTSLGPLGGLGRALY